MNFGIINALMIIFCTIHLLAAEYIPAQRSKGEVLLFHRGRHGKKQSQRGLDAENPDVSPIFAQDIDKQVASKACDEHSDAIMRPSSVLHWNNLSYEGVTGAGKTTLLDVLANRATFGTASGEVCIDGTPRDASFQRKIGYVQQEDIHLPTATVREALEFSALLRKSGSTSRKEKLDYVKNVIEVLDMGSYSEAVVGYAGSGLNIEQRKRLSIGVELVAKPELVLFLDEPTSGLDSQTAWSTCSLLRKLADHGQAVLCTIHQPSSQLFRIFDCLLLVNDHGETVYFGDIGQGASKLIGYFEALGAPMYRPENNPAEWVLNVISHNIHSSMSTMRSEKSPAETDFREWDSNWSQKWSESPQHQAAQQYLQQFTMASDSSPEGKAVRTPVRSEYATSFFRQLVIVTELIKISAPSFPQKTFLAFGSLFIEHLH
ncbi:hypothetical protein OCU04_000954 [Sclerotinia nivalis]|uniref:ABC transporter domain-containing protein n=1 Tax=Sclerotinia nivalis TaxID=352851 RepID=A0A9X0AX61_9HELO|nr:hypothetical protein OCU04_000954 [Sclerotinia nivalis]